MAAPINTTTLPTASESSHRGAVTAGESKAKVSLQTGDVSTGPGVDHVDLSGAGLRLGRASGTVNTPQAAAALVATLRRQMGVGPTMTLKAYSANAAEQLGALLRTLPAA